MYITRLYLSLQLSRSALLSEIVSKGLLAYVPQEVKDLYSLLETEFHPLDLATRLEPLLAKLADIGDSLSPASPVPEVRPQEYVAALQKVTTAKLLAQVRVGLFLYGRKDRWHDHF